MRVSILPQSQAFRAGMLDVLQEPGLLALFTAQELAELLGGAATIDDAAVERCAARLSLAMNSSRPCWPRAAGTTVGGGTPAQRRPRMDGWLAWCRTGWAMCAISWR
jgi:hypothetical protein